MGDGPHGTKSEPLLQRDRIRDGPQVLKVLLVSQCQPHRGDLCLGTMTDMRNRTMEDLAVGALRLAQQMPRIGCATPGEVRGIDIHRGYYNNTYMQYKQGTQSI